MQPVTYRVAGGQHAGNNEAAHEMRPENGEIRGYRSLIHDVRRVWLYAQPGSGEAAFDEQGLVLDLLQAVPDHLDQLGEAGHGGVGQDAALEYGPDPCHRVQVRGVGRELEDVQPWLGAGEGAQLRAQMHVEVVPDQHDDSAGQ